MLIYYQNIRGFLSIQHYCNSRHSDINIVDKSEGEVNDEEKAKLIDAGVQPVKLAEPSVKEQLYRCWEPYFSCSSYIPLILMYQKYKRATKFCDFLRFLTLNEAFLLENRLTFRAM
jgi:hypothetical protein